MDYSSSDGMCSICLCSVVDDNTRGKAQLICGHVFHLDCIGTEFNYRGAMKCPNCRITENGEWRVIIDDDEEFDEEDFQHHHSQDNNVHRVEFHIYPHNHPDNNVSSTSTQRDADVDASHQSSGANVSFNVHQDGRSLRNNNTDGQQASGQFLPIFRTFHYHHHTIVMPPSPPPNLATDSTRASASDDPMTVDASFTTFTTSHDISNPTQTSTRPDRERIVLQDRDSPSNATNNMGPPDMPSSMDKTLPLIRELTVSESEPLPLHEYEDNNNYDNDNDKNLSLELTLSIGRSDDVQPSQDSDDPDWYDVEEDEQTNNATTTGM